LGRLILLALVAGMFACGGDTGSNSTNNADTTPDTTAPTTSASPAGGTYYAAQPVTLSVDEAGTAYYTTDGSTPTTGSTEYSSSINITDDATLKFFSVDSAGNTEAVKTETYVIGTSVSGSITSNTTWTLANSPYGITGSVQVEDAGVLTIEPGVEVGNGGMTTYAEVVVYGTLNAAGTASQKVSFSGTLFNPGYNADLALCNINISYALIAGGGMWSNSSGYFCGSCTSPCDLNLNNSVLQSIYTIDFLSSDGEKIIEKNIFIESGGIDSTFSRGTVIISNNVFYKQTSGYAVQYIDNDTTLQYNSFLSTDRVAVGLPSLSFNYSTTATDNYWGTTDTSVIDTMIYDKNDYSGTGGYGIYTPILTSPHADTPDPAAYIP